MKSTARILTNSTAEHVYRLDELIRANVEAGVEVYYKTYETM